MRGIIDSRNLLEHLSNNPHVFRLADGLSHMHLDSAMVIATTACQAKGQSAQAAERKPQRQNSVRPQRGRIKEVECPIDEQR